jgi:uncharacterized membrane protein
MENNSPKGRSPVFHATQLIIYPITFALFVIYYIQQGMFWFKLSWLAIVVSAITAFIKILLSYKKRGVLPRGKQKANTLGIVLNFLFFAIYIFCLLVQIDQWNVPASPPLVVIPLLAIPLLISFALFLYADIRDAGNSNESQP